jgi:uncharacterized membrane protein YphA (DoxX/SURF4 family)
METVAVILVVVLAVAFLAAGATKLAGQQTMIDNFDHFGYPQWFRLVTGAIEVAISAILLASLAVEALAVIGAVLVIGVMIGAQITHAKVKDPIKARIPPAVLLVLAVVLAAIVIL